MEAVEQNKVEALERQRAVASALIGLATTRAKRAMKHIQLGEYDEATEELSAVDEMLQKISNELV